MNDHHLVSTGVDAAGRPVETIVPGVRPVEPEKKVAKKDDKKDEK